MSALTQSTITNARVTGLNPDDYVLIGMNTVRKVESITTVNGDTTVMLDQPFGKAISNATIHRINDSLTNMGPWDDNYASYAMAEVIGSNDASYRAVTKVSRYRARHAIADSDVGKSATTTPLDRISGTPTGTLNTADVLVVRVSGASASAIDVADVSGDRIEMEDVPGATSDNPLGLDANETAYLVYWAEERNETGSVVTVRSQVRPGPVTVVLTETTPVSGEFVLEIATVAPVDAHGNRVVSDLSASPPTLPVNPRDVVTLSGADTSGTLQVESTPPVFSGLNPPHNTAVRDDRPEVTAQVTDGDSGLDEDGDSIYVIFRITEGADIRTVELRPSKYGEVDEIPGGFEIRQRLPRSHAPSGDAVIEWWVKAIDNAGNVGYSDSDPFSISVDRTELSLLRAETGRHWDTSLDTGDSDDKTEYRVSRADPTSVLVVFDEHLDDATVTAADFEVDGDTPIDAEVHNVMVRDDSEDGEGNSAIMGDDVLDVGLLRSYVFLTVEEMSPDARPRVELVDSVSDLAGNRRNNGKDHSASDRTAPTLTVTVIEGDRPVTRDTVNLTITSNENIGTPSVTYHTVVSSNSGQALGAEKRAARVVFKSPTEYTATIDPVYDGLHTVYVTTRDTSGGNMGSKGDNSPPVDVDRVTSAILFERDTGLPSPDLNPALPGVQDEFSTEDPSAFISIDYSGEASEYYQDTHGMVTIVSAMLDDMDITDDLQSNQAGNVFQYRATGLAHGEHTLSVTAMDEAGNTQPSVAEVTRCDPGQTDCTPPTVSMSVVSANILVRINTPIPMTATFSRPVSGFAINDIGVVSGATSNFAGGDGSRVYSFDVTPTDIGEVTVDILAGVSEDANGNGNSAAVQLSLGIPYDDDHDGLIGGPEILDAVRDYFLGKLTPQQILALVGLYFESAG